MSWDVKSMEIIAGAKSGRACNAPVRATAGQFREPARPRQPSNFGREQYNSLRSDTPIDLTAVETRWGETNLHRVPGGVSESMGATFLANRRPPARVTSSSGRQILGEGGEPQRMKRVH